MTPQYINVLDMIDIFTMGSKCDTPEEFDRKLDQYREELNAKDQKLITEQQVNQIKD